MCICFANFVPVLSPLSFLMKRMWPVYSFLPTSFIAILQGPLSCLLLSKASFLVIQSHISIIMKSSGPKALGVYSMCFTLRVLTETRDLIDPNSISSLNLPGMGRDDSLSHSLQVRMVERPIIVKQESFSFLLS